MPLSDMVSISAPGTQEELGYNEMGETCADQGPGNMLGYDRRSATAKHFVTHADGKNLAAYRRHSHM
ncbi:MAG: hypothetical protein ACLUD0_17765 [Eubacterium ramulus]